MRKQWPGVCIAALLLAACSGEQQQAGVVQAPAAPVCNGPIVEISGAEPRYETPVASANQDYQHDGKKYTIVKDPASFSQSGLAAIYDAEPNSNLTASGEAFDPTQLTAAHPTLPVPSYARITNLANGRMIIVKINDRGPYGDGRAISLSRAAADRLNTSNNTKVSIDPIIVAQDGSMSGPGMACVTVAKQTYALPARPDLGSNIGGGATNMPVAAQGQTSVQPISNSTLQPQTQAAATTTQSGGFLGAPKPLAAGILEDSSGQPTTTGAASTASANTATSASSMITPHQTQSAAVVAPGTATTTAAATATAAAATTAAASDSDSDTTQSVGQHSAPVTAPGSLQGSAAGRSAASASGYVVQVGAVSDSARASQWQQKLSQQFSVPGRVSQNGLVYRVQLGPFTSRSAAIAVQQRLANEAQQQSFIMAAPAQ